MVALWGVLRMKKICVLLMLGFLATLGLLGWFGYQSYTTGFSAKAEPNELEVLIARQVRQLAIPYENRRLRNPLPLTQELLKDARAHFADHCASCHANNGSGDTVIGKNVYPKSPDLRLPDTQTMSDGELFFIIQNGIRFTAMPGWGTGDPAKDRGSWELVHFIRHLPSITEEELQEMATLNPKTKKELQEESMIDQFLGGDDAAASGATGAHRH
ncbi:MAG: cytochrome c [Nitrospira sp.]|uniref:Cytochrome C n=2 Tax=Nitrospira defluvii TaxID=330214 RepID=A0ABM8QIP0_9BACT|nr:cytochrome c [Nitrospira sp.]CAE6699036.1 Cytochrome C [Nitrospira defluvii]